MTIRSRLGSYGALVSILVGASCALAAAAFASAREATASSLPRAGSVKPLKPVNARALRGGVVATFDVHGELFRVWVTNSEAIDQLFALQQGRSTASIPIGRLLRGPGRAAHNAPWRWHFDPEQFALADFTIELCDARPSYVQENLNYFVKTVRTYCPWEAILVDLRDLRQPWAVKQKPA
jgi:hypothetical protein